MRKRYYLFLLVLSIFTAIFLARPVMAASAKMNYKQKTMIAGETFKLNLDGTKAKATWTSSKPEVASVNAKTGKVKALKQGKTKITAKLGNKEYTCIVQVRDVVDIIVFAGQSNMTGVGCASQAPKLTEGAGYAYNYVTNRKNFSTLKEPFGYGQDDSYCNNGSYASGSLVTSFVNAYYARTKTPVIAVPASCVGSGSVSWRDFRYKSIIQRVNAAVNLAEKKDLNVGHVYLVWMQGENDAFAGMSAEQHTTNLKAIMDKVQSKTRVEKCMIIGLANYYKDKEVAAGYDVIRNAQKSLCNSNKDFLYVSEKASYMPPNYLQADGLHLNQYALNIIGEEAGTNAAKYSSLFRIKTPYARIINFY